MTIREIRGELKKSPMSAWYFVQGSIRYIWYKSKYLKWLLRKHVIEQFEWRRDECGRENTPIGEPFDGNPCYWAGSCRCCGCKTPDLFFASVGCKVGKKEYEFCSTDKKLSNCYPKLMRRKEWNKFKKSK